MAVGKDSYWQIGKETTPGTQIAATRKSEMISEGFEIDVDTLTDPSLFNARAPRAVYQGRTQMQGPLEVRGNYEGAIMKLFEGALGSVASAVVGGETVVRDHTIKEGSTLPTYTIEMSKGNVPTSKVIRALGATVTSLEFNVGTGQDSFARVRAQLQGTDLDPNTGTTPAGYDPTASFIVGSGGGSSGSPVITTSGNFITSGVTVGMGVTGSGVGAGAVVISITSATSITVSVNNAGAVSGNLTFALDYPGLLPILGKQVVTLNNGVDSWTYPSGAGRVRSCKVTIENPLEERPYLGSVQPDTPLPGDFYKVTWEFEEEYQTLKAYQAARLYTDTSPRIKLQDSATIGSTSKRELEIFSTSCRCKYSNPIERYGVVLAKSTHQAYYNTTDASQIVVRFRNLDAAP